MIKISNPEVIHFPYKDMPNLEGCASFNVFRKGQTIFYKGHSPYGLYILVTGEVDVIYSDKDVEKVDSSSFLGVSAFLKKSVYSASAITLTNCNVYFLSTGVYKDLLEQNNTLALWIKNLVEI